MNFLSRNNIVKYSKEEFPLKTASTSSENGRAAWIATLRGFAALLVYFSHLKLAISSDCMFLIGRIGVVIFFLIMGYLTFSSYKKRTPKQYIINRLFRLYPEFWVLLLIAYISQSRIVPPKVWLTNITLFNEFFGCGNILGASWMMPIQVCFFGFVFLFGKRLFSPSVLGKWILGIGMLSVLSGALRYITNKAVPTAFPLLFLVSLIGISYYFTKNEGRNPKKIFCYMLIFEIALFFGTILSYENWVYYIAAYNLGIFLFYLFDQWKCNVRLLIELGKIGFPFFLCFDIIYSILCRAGLCVEKQNMSIMAVIAHLFLSLIVAFLVTKYVERPLLNTEKKLEMMMR